MILNLMIIAIIISFAVAFKRGWRMSKPSLPSKPESSKTENPKKPTPGNWVWWRVTILALIAAGWFYPPLAIGGLIIGVWIFREQVLMVLGTIVLVAVTIIIGNLALGIHRWAHKPTVTTPTQPAVEFPVSGSGSPTKTKPVKAWLDPMRTYLRTDAEVIYVLKEDPSISFTEVSVDQIEPNDSPHRQKWLKLPAGEYLVYAKKGEAHFWWWQ